MKAKITLYTSDKKAKEGFPIKLIVSSGSKRKRKSLGFYSTESNWDFDKDLPKRSHSQFSELFPFLANIQSRIILLPTMQFNSIDEVINFLLKKQAKEISKCFYEFADEFIQRKRNLGKEKTAEIYRTGINQLKVFSPDLNFDELTYSLLMDFKEYKLAGKTSNNTISNYFRTYRSIYNDACKRGIAEDKSPFKGVFSGLKTRAAQNKKKYLTKETVKLLENAELTGVKDKIRNMFLLQFFLGGQDLKDIYYLKWNQIYDGRIFFKRSKIGQKGYEFDLKIFDKTQTILDKLSSDDSIYVLDGRKDFTGYETFRRRYTRYLIQIQQELKIEVQPKGGNLGIKVARHTFANIGKRELIEEDLLRELMGHERDDIDNWYKDRFPESIRDRALWKIIC
ncbi:site-specific integrase [Aureivirga marina]|uniref:site-specific integrase n=1 Tax=Aureivirga marina TaxID=1182451 RepID=UPI0018C91218|nr:site-specific integrase [Aureivirga marina]